MEKNCTMVYFSIRESKKTKDGKSPIEVSISVSGRRIYFNSGKRILVSDWDKSKQLVKGKSDESTLINSYLIAIRNKIYQKEIELIKKGFVITAELLKDAYLDRIESLSDKTLFQVFQEHNDQQQAMIGKGISKSTYFVSEYTLRMMKDFMKLQYKREDIYLRELNLNFIKEFHIYLLKRMGQNSCSKHLKLLKKIINIAVANSYMQFNPFAPYKVERTPVDVEFLDEDELRRIINFNSVLPRLEKAKDMFLFGCFTGLAYIDIKTLTENNLETDKEGRMWIKKRRVKTGVLSRIPLLPMAKMILDKYRGGEKLIPIQDPA
ncbi:MAG: site-specific integrase, partial [Anaerovoracaceae bacterium]